MPAKIVFAAFLILSIVSCKPEGNSGRQSTVTPRIVCTTGIVGDMVSGLTKGVADVQVLMGPGVDPHLFKISQQDLGKIQEADLVVYNGFRLEGKMSEVLASLGSNRSIALGELFPNSLLLYSNGSPDPHFWFDVSLWAITANALKDNLVSRYPQFRVQFEKNAQEVSRRLESLHNEIKAAFDALPAERRVLVTAHDAFGYYGRAYGIEVHGLQGISTLAEFGLQDLSSMTNFLCERKIPAVFIESSVSPRSIEAVKEGCAKRGHSITLGGTLYSDALGEQGKEAGNYEGMLRYNTRTITDALQGQ
jgi:manganese/zinc/iron transport system substrate-binding protein